MEHSFCLYLFCMPVKVCVYVCAHLQFLTLLLQMISIMLLNVVFLMAIILLFRSDLMVKKLRYYARFIVVCLLLKKMKLVRDLVRVSICFEANIINLNKLSYI